MPLQALVADPLLLAAPLNGFLARRLPTGRFGAPRSSSQRTDAIGTRSLTYSPRRVHEGVDLDAKEGDPVFAVTDARVAVSAADPNDSRGPAWLILDHHPAALGHISVYYHLGVGIAAGSPTSGPVNVVEGQLIGFMGRHPSGPHLHFELRHVTVPAGALDSDRSSVPLNPGPSLERHSFSDDDATETGPGHIRQLWVMQHEDLEVPYLRIRIDSSDENFFLPLEHPTADDLQMASALRLTFDHGNEVRLRFVRSGWHGQRRIIRGVRMVT